METTIPQSVCVPEGMALVPLEPTSEMVNAPHTIIQAYGAKLIYQRMLAAAPAAPLPQPQADAETVMLHETWVATELHWPECWDTAAYPKLSDALSAVFAHFKCSECALIPHQGEGIIDSERAAFEAAGRRKRYNLTRRADSTDDYAFPAASGAWWAWQVSARLARTAAQPCNFCPECGKPTPPESIHTCTPPARIAAPSEPAETIQWRNIKHVVQEIAKFCFGDGSHPQYGSAYIAVTSALTAKDGLQVMLEPLHATPMSAVNKMLETSQLDELGHEVARLQTALCFWLPSVTDREDEVADRILQDAFLLCGIDGNIPDDFKTAQELGWVTLATAPQVPEPSAPAPLEAQPIPTDLSKRLRSQASTHLVAMIRQDILAAADEIDRYYGGMLAWKKTAEEKDAASTSLWNALDLMVSTFERPIGMYANERKACDIARTALSRPAAPAPEAPTVAPSARTLPPLPEMESLADLAYALNTPDDWDAEYCSIWKRLQVVERNKMQWRVYAHELRAILASTSAPTAAQAPEVDISAMVNRFLGWKLPETFGPDCGISFDGRKDDEWNKNKSWPIGTNLLTSIEAKAMFEYCIATQPNSEACAFPERDQSKPAEQQGLFRKFEVRRVDGSDQPGRKHYGCRYYVLDLDHDPHAGPAMAAYAESCRFSHHQLSDELRAEFGAAPVAEAPIEPGTKQAILLALADRIDHEKLWRLAGMDHDKLTNDQKDRMQAGVMLRRYADIWTPGHWIVVPPTGSVQYGASTLDKAVGMAKKDESRHAATPATEQAKAEPQGYEDGGRNMFFKGLFEGETESERAKRLRWASAMRAAFERHFGQPWFDKDWFRETGIWTAAWNACLAAQASPAKPDLSGLMRYEPAIVDDVGEGSLDMERREDGEFVKLADVLAAITKEPGA